MPNPYASTSAPPAGDAQPALSVHEWQMPQAAGHYAPTSAPQQTCPCQTVSSSQGGGSAATASSHNTAATERTYPGIAPDPRFHDDMRLTHNNMTVPEMVEYWHEHPQQVPDGVGGYSGQITLRRGEAWILVSNSSPPRSPENDQHMWWTCKIMNLFSVPGWFNQITRRLHVCWSNMLNTILYARDMQNVTPEQVVEHLLCNGITNNMVILLEEISCMHHNWILHHADDDMSDWPCEPMVQMMIKLSAPNNVTSGPSTIHAESALVDSHMIVDCDDPTNSACSPHHSRSSSQSPTNSVSFVEDLYEPTKRAAQDPDGGDEPNLDSIASSAEGDMRSAPLKSPPLPPLPDEDEDDLMQGPE
ncbi:hypothetical protein EWM64_g10904 [Hericium alpestre]|uniref:Uncharacterized protein n=1 Tax=Hericium alpestre TaxID=135208 RepID=A0A4Y9ZH52_9AGAM|nr:hypothetical protein EWM64_g10904 [Hericium alpestre]